MPNIFPKSPALFAMDKLTGLPNRAGASSICGTTTYNANRKRYSSGIFLPKIHLSMGEHRPKCIEFAVRLINRNKASNRTNKVSCLYAVVETVSHPKQGDTYLLTKTYKTIPMKNNSQSEHRPKSINRTPNLGGAFITHAPSILSDNAIYRSHKGNIQTLSQIAFCLLANRANSSLTQFTNRHTGGSYA